MKLYDKRTHINEIYFQNQKSDFQKIHSKMSKVSIKAHSIGMRKVEGKKLLVSEN